MVSLAFLLNTNDFYVRFLVRICLPVEEKLVLYDPGPSVSAFWIYFSGLFGWILKPPLELYLDVMHMPL
jgi:hypothetical protein